MDEKKTRRPSSVVKEEKIAAIEKSIKYHEDCIVSLKSKLEAVKNNKTKVELKNELLNNMLAEGVITPEQAKMLGLRQ